MVRASLVMAGMLVVVATGCSSAPATHLDAALRYVTPDVTVVGFSDWAAIKTAAGHPEVTSGSPLADRYATYVDIVKTQALTTSFDTWGMSMGSETSEPTQTQASVWGFDNLDIDWMLDFARGPTSRAVTHVVRFPTAFDLAPLKAAFDRYGFTTEQIGDVVLRTKSLSDIDAFDYPGLDYSMLGAALLADGHTVLLGLDVDGLRAYVPLLAQVGLPGRLSQAIGALGGPEAFIARTGSAACSIFGPTTSWRLDAPSVRQFQDLIASAGTLADYDSIAWGYDPSQAPNVRVAMAYSDAATASHDAAGRRLLADQGVSLGTDHQPYATHSFTVAASKIDGATVTIDMTPSKGEPIRLIADISAGDFLPAVCGS